MVRSKEPSKKKQPKDPLLTPPSKPRGGGFLDEGRPWNRGGAAISPAPAPASVPSYMRGTSSSDAKAGRRGRPAASVSASASPARWRPAASVSASASPARRRPAVRVLTKGKVLFAEEAPGSAGLIRATCSSTMKDAKFPDALDLAPGATDAEGPAALRVCPYTYCSLNGHVHAPAVPLRSFLASRRRLIKTQQSMKLKGVSAFRKKSEEKTGGGSGGGGGAKIAPLIDEEAVGDFFVEVYGGPRVSSEMSCSDMSLDEMDATVRRMEFVVFDRCGSDEDAEKVKDPAVCHDGEAVSRLMLKEKHDGAFRDSLSDCSAAHTGSDFVEELPWLRYHGYEYDDSLDDEILEEQRIRGEEVVGAEFSAEQEEEQGTSGRSSDEYKEDAAEGQEENDEENTSNLVRDQGILADQGVACRVQAYDELDGRDDDNIPEASAEQGAAEEKPLSDDIYKSEIPDQEVTASAGATLEEQRIREEGVVGAESSAEQEEEQGTSGGSSDEYKEGADEESTTNLVRDQEILADQGVACRVEACEELDGRDEDNILEASAGQGTAEEKLSDDIYKSEIPDQEVTARAGATLEDSFKEDISSDQEANDDDEDECHAESDGESEVTEEQDLEDQQSMPKDGSEMEISEDTISGDGCKEDFSEEVTSTAEFADDVFEQYDNSADDVPEQDSSPANAQKELGNPTGKNEDAFEETATVEQINQDSSVDTQKELEIMTSILEESGITQQSNPDDDEMEPEVTVCKLKDASEESGNCPESNLVDNTEYVTDDAEMGQEVTRCKLEDASKETGIDQETLEVDSSTCVIVDDRNNLDINNCKLEDVSKESVTTLEADHSDNSANFSNDVQGTSEDHDLCLIDDAQNDIQITRCKLEECKEFDTMKEIDQGDSFANARSDAEETVQDDGSVCVSDDAQNDLKFSKCNSEDASKEPSTVQEADRSDSSANVNADSEETVEDDGSVCVRDDAQNDLKFSKCNLDDASKEPSTAQEAHQSDNSANVGADAQNGSELTSSELAVITISNDKGNESKLFTCNSEDVFEESIIGQEADHGDSSVYLSYGSQNEYEVTTCHSEGAQVESDVIQEDEDKTAGTKKLESTACESGGASLKPAMHQEASGDINTTDASKDVHVTEETNPSFNVQMPAEFIDAKEPSIDDICGAFSGMNLKGDVYFDPAESSTCPRNKLIISRRRRTPEEEEYLRGFNPRAPNFLPLELDPDAEKVDLKHQMMDERKNAEEWMIDYALRRALTNLAPARKKKVELLVQAFETVVPHDEDDKKSISRSRPVQPCN